ncbi:hypothetical protein IB286_06705 [Spongiibacter sp. KMU-158]|uniref:Lipoprotein n=1 Tax=Spongiibacter pelagi TaxID=2760804 RepID=A0A927C204_9GAMM|nr:hypothetical protein [Spongiibacter pelagi]MBD2858698.1 hypothetical protein [Spongiibacter pelagi]
MQYKLILAVLVTGFLAACSSTSVYQPAEKRGAYGYTETQLGADRYRVTFTGNSVTDKETVNDYAMLRAAELTLQNGYEWFQMVNRDTESKSRSSTNISGMYDYGGGTAVYQRCGLVSCNTYVTQVPSRIDGGVATTTTRTSYQSSLEVKMGKGQMPESAEAYNAQELASTLRRWMNNAK